MSTLGSYEVHKSDHDFNPNVLGTIALARHAKDPRDYIDCLYGGKAINDIRNTKEEKRNDKRRLDLSTQREEGDER